MDTVVTKLGKAGIEVKSTTNISIGCSDVTIGGVHFRCVAASICRDRRGRWIMRLAHVRVIREGISFYGSEASIERAFRCSLRIRRAIVSALRPAAVAWIAEHEKFIKWSARCEARFEARCAEAFARTAQREYVRERRRFSLKAAEAKREAAKRIRLAAVELNKAKRQYNHARLELASARGLAAAAA